MKWRIDKMLMVKKRGKPLLDGIHASLNGSIHLLTLSWFLRLLKESSLSSNRIDFYVKRNNHIFWSKSLWVQFCSFEMQSHCLNIISSPNNSRYLIQDPYPHDSRCGCPICPDCRYQQPCGGLGYSGSSCDGSCVVCTGLVPPGPLEITSKT